MLTDVAIRKEKAGPAPRKLFDFGGLYLLLNPDGSRWWRFKYRIFGREKLLSLGVYPEITLKRARDRRDEARRLIADGVDPAHLSAKPRSRQRVRTSSLWRVDG
jgi:hypothetical protein